jgi:rifampicin phosphotransferase
MNNLNSNSFENDIFEGGGKARNLAVLQRHGLSVPIWHCISGDLYSNFIKPHQHVINEMLNVAADTSTGMNEASQGIRNYLLNVGVVGEIQSGLVKLNIEDDTARYAVRSSCNVEDATQLSYAGIFETFLHVSSNQIESKVRDCWLSVFSPSALSYMRKNGVPPLNLKMTVIIQKMVDSQKSGILFQSNPVGRLEELLIVAGHGLGEGVVSDQVASDTYFYNKYTKTHRSEVVAKDFRIGFDAAVGYGTRLYELAPELHNAPVLNSAEIVSLIELSNSLEKIYTHPQDVEWAIDNNKKLWILQSRPITTIPEVGDVNLYDNSNITESYPGISSPLTCSLVKVIYSKLFYNAYYAAGCSRKMLKPYEEAFDSMVENIQGRIYYNMTNWHKQLSLLPFSSRVFIPALEDAIGSRRTHIVEASRFTRLQPKLRLLMTAITRFFGIHQSHTRYTRDFNQLASSTRISIEKASSALELKSVFSDFFGRIFSIDQFGRLSDAYLMLFLYVARVFFIRQGLSETQTQNLINDLLVGEEELASVQPVRSIQRIASDVNECESLASILSNADSWDKLLQALQAFDDFRQRLVRHLELFGDRTIAELKFETRTFRQEPLALVRMILAHASERKGSSTNRNRELQRRESAERRLSTLFQGKPIRRNIGRFVIDQLRMFIRRREDVRFNRARYYGLIREIINRIALDWQSRGLLTKVDDIYFLTESEIFSLNDPTNSNSLKSLIEARRVEWEKFSNQQPEERFWLKGSTANNFIPQVQQGKLEAEDNTVMQGVGCCSGIVESETCVLLSPDQTTDIAGKILVARNTDPGWVFLIMRASGLIVERGSLLSHTAIIGRELGIPTIVGVQNATQRLRHLGRVRMDGNVGTIQSLI